MPKNTRTRTRGRAERASAERAPKRARASPESRTASRVKGRAAMNARVDEEGQIDGCDIDFTASEATADADLPPAKGGVETSPRTRRRK